MAAPAVPQGAYGQQPQAHGQPPAHAHAHAQPHAQAQGQAQQQGYPQGHGQPGYPPGYGQPGYPGAAHGQAAPSPGQVPPGWAAGTPGGHPPLAAHTGAQPAQQAPHLGGPMDPHRGGPTGGFAPGTHALGTQGYSAQAGPDVPLPRPPRGNGLLITILLLVCAGVAVGGYFLVQHFG
jgi:hypothetical protein